MSTPELLNSVQQAFDLLKGGNVSLGNIVSLVEKFSANKDVKIPEVLENAIVRVEKEVVSLLPDDQKAVCLKNLELARKFLSDYSSLENVKTGIFSQIMKLFSSLSGGLCCIGGRLPELPSQVVTVRELVQKVADVPLVQGAVKAVEQVVGVSVVEETVKAVEKVVDVSVVQKAVEKVVEDAVKAVDVSLVQKTVEKALEQATEVVGTHQVAPVSVPEGESPAPPSSKVVEENPAPVPQGVQDNKMD